MPQSMTAFARDESISDAGTITWELRSVNHRYLELNLRLPDQLRQLEPRVRELLQTALKRGKIDCTLKYQPPQNQGSDLHLNQELIDGLLVAISHLEPRLPDNHHGTSALDLLAWPGAVDPPELPDNKQLLTEATDCLKLALKQLCDTRKREGHQLGELISERLDTIDGLVDQIAARVPEILALRGEKLRSRVADMAATVDPERLEQELVITAQKADVEEELDRLRIHLGEVRDTLKRNEPIGRRLDFLMQELNREANTTASKSIDGAMTGLTVDLKVLIEQMREQVQNIE
ncbi:MAG: YicC family protein [Immundisolibacteraceae bacterium]|nr:YicC family protein [Immundisolibacteraceae bacterium]